MFKIQKNGYMNYSKVILVKPYFIYTIEPLLIETISLKKQIVFNETKRRRNIVNMASYSTGLLSSYFLYSAYTNYVSSKKYWDRYLLEVNPTKIDSHYEAYSQSLNKSKSNLWFGLTSTAIYHIYYSLNLIQTLNFLKRKN